MENKSNSVKEIIFFNSFPVKIGITTNRFGDFSFDNIGEKKVNMRLADQLGAKSYTKLRCSTNGKIDTSVYAALSSGYGTIEGEMLIDIKDERGRNKMLIGNTGDCPYVFLTDKKVQFIGLIHSGLRGTDANLVGSFIHRMELACPEFFDPDNIVAFIWPGICQKCYQVGDEYISRFKNYIDGKNLGLKFAITDQLSCCGVKAENILWPDESYCSAHTPQYGEFLFSSYRRDTNLKKEKRFVNRRNAVFITYR